MESINIWKCYVFAVPILLMLRPIFCQYYDYITIDPQNVGGRSALKGEAYYQLAVVRDGGFRCGATLVQSQNGSLIHPQIVITAAHCVCQSGSKPYPAGDIAFVGDILILSEGDGHIRFAVEVICPETYNDVSQFGIAIAFLESPFEETETFFPIKLPDSQSAIAKIEKVTVSGWGHIQDLQIATLPMISNARCTDGSRDLSSDTAVFEHTFCAGYGEGQNDSFQSDCGGPAAAEDSEGLFLTGVVSWGEGCAKDSKPGSFTKVSKYVDWILSHTVNH